jgi:hypothetical protein
MIVTNKLTTNPIDQKQNSSSKLASEKFILIAGTLLFVFFTILLSLVVRSLFYWVREIFEWLYITNFLVFSPFILLATLSGFALLYLLHIPRVLTQLFQSFWSSLEDEE